MFLCPRCENILIGEGGDCQHCTDEHEKAHNGCLNSPHGAEFDALVDKYGDSGEDEDKMPLHLRS